MAGWLHCICGLVCHTYLAAGCLPVRLALRCAEVQGDLVDWLVFVFVNDLSGHPKAKASV